MRTKIVLLALAVFFVTSAAFATDAICQIKMAVVDLQLAVASTKEGKRAKDKLEALTTKKQKELDDRVEKIKKMEEDMQKQLPLMSDAGKKEILEKYRKDMMELQQLYVDNQTVLGKKKADLLEPILKKMSGILKDLAMSDGYTMILDSSSGVVLYNEPTIDLTTELIKRYNNAK